MKIEKIKKDKLVWTAIISEDAPSFEKLVAGKLAEIAKTAKLDGFRAGHAPLPLLEKK